VICAPFHGEIGGIAKVLPALARRYPNFIIRPTTL
jgi:hypothetical protein